MTAQTKEGINLLPERGFASTTTGRVLAWILSTFRIIVIVTEIIVMIAFLSRFWLDARNTDLAEEINQKKAVLTASANFEREFKNTQNKLEIFKALAEESGKSSQLVKNAVSVLPADVSLTKINLSGKKVSIDGSSPSERGIQQFVVNLSNNILQNTSLTEASTSPEDSTLIDFKITGEIE